MKKSRKEKKITEFANKKLLIRAPYFIGTQNDSQPGKMEGAHRCLFPEYLQIRKLENMVKPTDFCHPLLYSSEMEKQDENIRFRSQKTTKTVNCQEAR